MKKLIFMFIVLCVSIGIYGQNTFKYEVRAPALKAGTSDTTAIFVFGLGSGAAADTACFNNNRIVGAFYHSGRDTIWVTDIRGVLVAGTGTETIDFNVQWDANMLDATPTSLNTTALTITSQTTGTNDTSFNNNGIPPGNWIWGIITGASKGNKPTALYVTMTVYKRNRSY